MFLATISISRGDLPSYALRVATNRQTNSPTLGLGHRRVATAICRNPNRSQQWTVPLAHRELSSNVALRFSHIQGCSGFSEALVADEAMEMGCPMSNKSVASDEYMNTWSLNFCLFCTLHRIEWISSTETLSVHDKLHNP
ncbi:hypothetical protein KC19_5G057300 [Ceratodon purpureus]|uniref:Uncharacterized protein n=1 Tax=Ceratodon purpureus TaxID=3225 RepID=A0A8T0HY83_CERPU|nr:hypothetical protein KC19_5G057300 [Ceratodon purpureus]